MSYHFKMNVGAERMYILINGLLNIKITVMLIWGLNILRHSDDITRFAVACVTVWCSIIVSLCTELFTFVQRCCSLSRVVPLEMTL